MDSIPVNFSPRFRLFPTCYCVWVHLIHSRSYECFHKCFRDEARKISLVQTTIEYASAVPFRGKVARSILELWKCKHQWRSLRRWHQAARMMNNQPIFLPRFKTMKEEKGIATNQNGRKTTARTCCSRWSTRMTTACAIPLHYPPRFDPRKFEQKCLMRRYWKVGKRITHWIGQADQFFFLVNMATAESAKSRRG